MAIGTVDQTAPSIGNRLRIVLGRGITPSGDVMFASSDDKGNPGALNVLVLGKAGYSIERMRSLRLKEKGFDIVENSGQSTVIVVATIAQKRATGDALRRNLLGALEALPGVKTESSNKSVWLPLMGTGQGGLGQAESFAITIEALRQTFPRWQPFVSEIILSCDSGLREEQFESFVSLATNSFQGVPVNISVYASPLPPGAQLSSATPGPTAPTKIVGMTDGPHGSSSSSPTTPDIPKVNRTFKDDTRTQVDVTTGKLGLGFDRIAQQIVAIVQDATRVVDKKEKSNPDAVFSAASDARLTIGLFAPWGAGKSTLIRVLRDRFLKADHVVITINPWKWDGKTDIHDHVRDKVVSQVAEQKPRFNLTLFKLRSVWRAYKTRVWAGSIVLAALVFLGPQLWPIILDILPSSSDANSKPDLDWGKALGALGLGALAPVAVTFLPKIIGWLSTTVLEWFKAESSEDKLQRLGADGLSLAYQDIARLLYQDQKGAKPFVFFFDDLDRCSPERVATVLDSVHSLTAAGCVVFLAFDEEYIVAALNAHFEMIAKAYADEVNFGRRFLEKIVQIGFRLPLVRSADIVELDLATRPATVAAGAFAASGTATVSGIGVAVAQSDEPIQATAGLPPSADKPLPEIRLTEIIGDLLDKAVEPMGLNIRQVKAISNTLKLYLGIAASSTEADARRLAAFVFADRFDPAWLDSIFLGIETQQPPIGSNPELAKLLSMMIGDDKGELTKMFHLLGRRPKPILLKKSTDPRLNEQN
jgi:hypothetical protein